MNDEIKVQPFGSWDSPLNASSIATASLGLQEIVIDGSNIYWLESRPNEGGRNVICRADKDLNISDVTPSSYSVRTLVNSYGGAPFTVHNDTLYFSNHNNHRDDSNPYARYNDQRIYVQAPGKEPQVLTDTLGVAYANILVDESRQRLIAIREDFHLNLKGQPMSSLVAIDLKSGKQELLLQGQDFYAYPRLSPDGTQLCWLSWNYPHMPWDHTQLWLADFDESGRLGTPRLIAGEKDESILQPLWSPEGQLYFISDKNNWWNIYRLTESGTKPVCLRANDFGSPLWSLGASIYDFASSENLLCAYTEGGEWQLINLNVANASIDLIALDFTCISQISAKDNQVVFLAGSPTTPLSLIRLDLQTKEYKVLRSSTQFSLDPTYISKPRPIVYPTSEGQHSYAFYYPPTNPDFVAPNSEKPPLIIKSHGGPSSAADTVLSLDIQYFTSRGFGVVDVNYRGSSGYGRNYRLSLYKNWGIYDVKDCENAALYLIEQGEVDPERVVARGGSSGGYTTLALATYTDLLKAGASYYGISNLEMIAQNSDKLEARYPDCLIGKWPEEQEIYQERSPLFHSEHIKAPMIFFQGTEDPVVPPEQTDVIFERLKEDNIPVCAIYFEKEQHGFRIAKHIQQALEAELYFYAKVLGFTLAETLPEIKIENWIEK